MFTSALHIFTTANDSTFQSCITWSRFCVCVTGNTASEQGYFLGKSLPPVSTQETILLAFYVALKVDLNWLSLACLSLSHEPGSRSSILLTELPEVNRERMDTSHYIAYWTARGWQMAHGHIIVSGSPRSRHVFPQFSTIILPVIICHILDTATARKKLESKIPIGKVLSWNDDIHASIRLRLKFVFTDWQMYNDAKHVHL